MALKLAIEPLNLSLCSIELELDLFLILIALDAVLAYFGVEVIQALLICSLLFLHFVNLLLFLAFRLQMRHFLLDICIL